MFNLNQIFNFSLVLKYTIIALIVAIVLKSVPEINIDDNTIIQVTLSVTLLIFLLEFYVLDHRIEKIMKEKMTVIPLDSSYDDEYRIIPQPDIMDALDEDEANTGIKYDNSTPGYYLANNGRYSENGISYGKVGEMINDSKYKYFLNQQNLAPEFPHTQVGKNVGYLNWDKNWIAY